MRMNIPATAACCVAAFPTVVSARAPFVIDNDVQPRVVAGKIVTDAIDDATGDVTPDVRHFGYEFGTDAARNRFPGPPRDPRDGSSLGRSL